MSEPEPHADTRPQPAAPSAGDDPTLNGSRRASGSAAVPPPKPARKRWLDDASAAVPPPPPAKRDPTLELPAEERIVDAESATPVDPWADADPLPAAGAPYPLGLPPTRPYTAALPPTPTPTPTPAPAPPPAAPPAPPPAVPRPVPAPATRPPAAPPAARPPRKVKADRRQKAAPPGWRPPPGYVAVPVRRRRRWPWVLLLTIACCCGVPAYIWEPVSRQWPASVAAQLPDSVADLDLRTDRASRRAADAADEATAAAHPLATRYAAVYGDGAGKRVTVFGVVGFRMNPESDVTYEIQRLVETYGITGIRTVDGTERGEHRRCGLGTERGVGVVVCTWADHGSLGTGVFTRRDIADSNDLLSTFRDTIIARDG